MSNFLSIFLSMALCSILISGCQSAAEIQRKDTGAKLHYEMGMEALQSRQLPRAFSELLKANKMNPNQPDVLDALGLAWRLQGNLAKADSFYHRLIHLPGATSRNYTNYASLLVQMRHYKQAEAMARKALNDPTYPDQDLALINLGDALLGQGRFKESVKEYNQARAFNPNNLQAVLHEAHAYASFGRYNYAKALYETKLREMPGNRLLTEALLSLLKNHNDIDDARQLLEAYRDNHNKDPLQKAWAEDELDQLDQQ